MSEMSEHTTATTGGRLDDPPVPTVWPSVGFVDVDAGMRFLTEALGFVITALHRDDDGAVVHAEARWPDGGGVMFGTRAKPGDWGALGPQCVYVVAAEAATVDAVAERAAAFDGVEIRQPPNDTDYGSHQIELRDADDNLWVIGTYRGA